MTLIELAAAERELLESLVLADDDPDWTPEQKEVIKQSLVTDYLATLDDLHEKMDSYVTMIRGLKFRAKFREEEARALNALAKADSSLVDILEKRLIFVLQQQGNTKVQTPHFKITVAQNGGKRPLVVPKEWEDDPANAPEQFHRHRIELDKETLRSILSEGVEVEGCKIGEAGFHLRIK